MLKNFIVQYWTTEGKLVGLPVSALSSIEAQNVVKSLPNFRTLAGYPKEV